MFVVFCCLALRLVALCVVRCVFSSCADLYVALICVALCVVRVGLSSCVAFGCFVCCSLWFVVLR